MDPQTDAVIEWIVDAASSTRTLLLANFRPEYRARWMGRTHYQQIAMLNRLMSLGAWPATASVRIEPTVE